jgi:hypothetical protein
MNRASTIGPKRSEFFGLRWRSLDYQNALPLTETA